MPMIGSRIRELRQNHNFTLEQVAFETGLSVSFLSMLERDKVSVSVDNLEKLARFFSVRLVHFFQDIEEGDVFITRRERIQERIEGIKGGQAAFILLANRNDARMEPLMIRIGPGHGDPKFRSHDGDSLIYVLEGSVCLISERGERFELKAGDSAYYFGIPGRKLENASNEVSATILLLTTPPTSMRDDVIDGTRGVIIQSEE